MSIKCILCGEQHVTLQEAIDIKKLNIAYKRSIGLQNAISKTYLSYYKCPRCGLGFFIPDETGNEAFYENLQSFDWYYMEDKQEFAIAKEYIPKNGIVLEVGAGKAAFANVMGTEFYTGLEFNNKAIERANQEGIRLLKQSIEEHASCCNLYDAVVSFQVLEHVADPSSFIRGCLQCLRPDGLLIVAVPANDGFVGGAVNNILNMPPHHITRWSGETLRKVATLFNITLLSVEYEPIAEYHKLWAHKIVWENKLRNFFHMSDKIFDYRLSARILSKAASILAQFFPVSLEDYHGHTVVAVFKK